MIHPLNDHVFLVRNKPADITASGLHLPESATARGFECRVLAVGPGRWNPNTETRNPMSIAAEDIVILSKYQGTEVDVPTAVRLAWNLDDRVPVFSVRESEILAVVEEEA